MIQKFILFISVYILTRFMIVKILSRKIIKKLQKDSN